MQNTMKVYNLFLLFFLVSTLSFGQSLTSFPIDMESSGTGGAGNSWFGFGGAYASVVNAPSSIGNPNPDNPNNHIIQLNKGVTETWAGIYATLFNPIDFSVNDKITMKVYSAAAGTNVKLKLEHPTDNSIFIEKDAVTTFNDEWEDIEFDFNGASSGIYEKVVLIFDYDILWYETASENPVYFFDDMLQSGGSSGPNCSDGYSGLDLNPNSYTLYWEDDFLTDGVPCNLNWSYEYGNGNNGWGNAEEQYYSASLENVYVSDGTLKIAAKKEGNIYTSGRIKSENKFEFTYGKIEFRAKLPSAAGTWPALWLLGENYQTAGNTWPRCGELDVMEQFANKTEIKATTHWFNDPGGNNADYGSATYSNTTASEFHVYGFEWTENFVRATFDGAQYYYMSTTDSDKSELHKDFFIIMNLALGGNKGAGAIDPNFTQDVLEIDYVKVYKKSGQLSNPSYDKLEVAVYPNPSSNNWNLNTNGNVIKEAILYDVLGKTINTIKPNSNVFTISNIDLKPGIYLLDIRDFKGNSKVIKLVKK